MNVCARSRVDKVYPRFHCSERVKEREREREREGESGEGILVSSGDLY